MGQPMNNEQRFIEIGLKLLKAAETLIEEMRLARGKDQLSVDTQLEIKSIAREYGKGNKKPLQLHNSRK